MTNDQQAIASGTRQVDERESLAAGKTQPQDISIQEHEPEKGIEGGPVTTHLGSLTLSMFEQGQTVRVRVGDPHNSSELYEFAYPSADEANNSLLDAGVLTPAQVLDPSKLVGIGIPLTGISVQQLEEAGLKRHGSSTL